MSFFRFEYFLRLVPPDRFQVKAMMDFIQYHNFTYISILYSEGSYGMNGAKYINMESKKRGICIAYNKQVSEFDVQKDYDDYAGGIMANSDARVVILFMLNSLAVKLLAAMERNKDFKYNYFIWVGSDYLSYQDYGQVANGYFYIFFDVGDTYPKFEDYYRNLTPAKSVGNPWVYRLWEENHNCQWVTNDTKKSCKPFENEPQSDYTVSVWDNKFYDAVWVYALALDALIRDKCPHAFQDATELDSCIKGKELLAYMKNLTFKGLSGNIRFDNNGDMLGVYTLNQYVFSNGKHVHRTIGSWDKSTETMQLEEDKITWNIFKKDLQGPELNTEIPLSVCSSPCGPREFPVTQEVACCWICRKCRENEYIVNDTLCFACPTTTWPHHLTARTCVGIEPTDLKPSDVMVICITAINAVLLATSLFITVAVIKNRHVKLIKASSLDLMGIIMMGITLAYLIVFTFIAKPSLLSCYVSHFGFNISATLIYTPLLVKTNRVYRIFAAGKKGVKKLRCIGSSSQLTLTSILVTVQVRERSLFTTGAVEIGRAEI